MSTQVTPQSGATQTASPAPATEGKAGGQAAAPAAAAKPEAPAAPATSLLNEPQAKAGESDGEGKSLLGSQEEPEKSGEPKPEEKNAGKENQQKSGAPEAYADFVMPEGVEKNEEVLNQFKGIAKELNLTQEQAQKLVDIQANASLAQQQAQQAQWKETVNEWKQETIHSLGANYKKDLAVAAKALDRFGSPELRKFLDESGLGNHKLLVSAFVKAGKLISEDSFAEGKPASAAPKSAAAVLYPTQTQR